MKLTTNELARHVGCGDLDGMFGCPDCDEIRRRLWQLDEVEKILEEYFKEGHERDAKSMVCNTPL